MLCCIYVGSREELQRLRDDHHSQLERNKQDFEHVSLQNLELCCMYSVSVCVVYTGGEAV